jgi:hypothetical protein
MSKWEAERADRNRRSRARLANALPAIFPTVVLSRALSRPFVPPTPRLAIDSYWSAHPIRADRLTRALATLSGPPSGWSWRLGNGRNGLPASFRTPPAPYREPAYGKGSGFCCVCGQPVYRFGWHVDLWDSGPNKNVVWHCACVVKRSCCAVSRRVAAAKLAEDSGGMPKLITGSRYFAFGPNTAIFRGQSCLGFGACQTFR